MSSPELLGLDRYLEQMNKLLEALNYFKKHNQNTVELRDVVGGVYISPNVRFNYQAILAGSRSKSVRFLDNPSH